MVKHSSKWKKDFEREKKKLRKVFGKDALDIQHVGSTAIAGVTAKPIIDIGISVRFLKSARRFVKKLQDIGYELKKDDKRKERLFFTKGPEEKRTHYLHIGEAGSGYVEEMILFRDYLRKYKETAHAYTTLKKELAVQFKEKRDQYTKKKGRFVREVIGKP